MLNLFFIQTIQKKEIGYREKLDNFFAVDKQKQSHKKF